MRILNSARLDSHSSFRLPSTATRVLQIASREGIAQALMQFGREPLLLLGAGSNSVFLEDVDATLLHYRGRGFCAQDIGGGRVRVDVGAGENWHRLVVRCCHAGWHGLENLALIPGDCGAAPVQNIGAYGVELADYLEWVDAFDLQQHRFVRLSNADCQFAYRDSLFKRQPGRYLITNLALCLHRDYQPRIDYADLAKRFSNASEPPNAGEVMAAVIAARLSKLPDSRRIGNCGSFFKNPIASINLLETLRRSHDLVPNWPVDTDLVKLSAGWLIQQAGLSGDRIGDAGVSEQHALVLVNHGQATGSQLARLIDRVRERVQSRFGIWLEPEVRLLGSQGSLRTDIAIAPQLRAD